MHFPPFLCPFQLEESEFTCASAVKARKSMEVEIEDLHVQMEDISKMKQAVSTALCFSTSHSWQAAWCDSPTDGSFDQVYG